MLLSRPRFALLQCCDHVAGMIFMNLECRQGLTQESLELSVLDGRQPYFADDLVDGLVICQFVGGIRTIECLAVQGLQFGFLLVSPRPQALAEIIALGLDIS
jgi:hypothetical protein